MRARGRRGEGGSAGLSAVLVPLAAGAYSGVFGSPLNTKAAFKSLPAQYGVVERTYSEHLSSAWPTFRVADFPKLPPDLQDGAFAAAYKAAQAAGKGGDYEDGSPRFYICETCHMAPRMGAGVSSLHNNAVVRNDLARHAWRFLQFQADTDVAMLNAMIYTIIEEGLVHARGWCEARSIQPGYRSVTEGVGQLGACDQPDRPQADLGLPRRSAHVARSEVVRRRRQAGEGRWRVRAGGRHDQRQAADGRDLARSRNEPARVRDPGSRHE